MIGLENEKNEEIDSIDPEDKMEEFMDK